jgi:uncharacterized lipoprotein
VLRLVNLLGIVSVLALALCSACSEPKSPTRDDLRSALRSADSYAAEIEMFIDYVQQGRATKQFAFNHAAQVSRQIEEDEKDLRGPAQPGTEQVQQACRAQFEFLRNEVKRVATLMGNTLDLQTERARVAQSRQLLAQTGAGL